jgi:hypothetical protein
MADCRKENIVALGKLSAPTRNNYFYGKLMDAFHFEMEQFYFNRKRWLLNRLGLGSGVLCGLDVVPTDDGHVVVKPGVAIDALGREIIVPVESHPIDPTQLTDECGRPVEAAGDSLWICLAYHECPSELVPVLVGDCDVMEDCAPSTTCERYRVLVRDEVDETSLPGCPLDGSLEIAAGQLTLESYEQLVALVSQACPAVDGLVCVPLARIDLVDNELDIHPEIRQVVVSNERLFDLLLCLTEEGGSTHTELPQIVDVSWEHDGVMDVSIFEGEGLTVTFSQEVVALAQEGRAWFIVTIEQATSETNLPGVLPGTIQVQRVLEEEVNITRDQATFKPREDFVKAVRDSVTSEGKIICRIVLRCDFLVDKENQALAVDGDFLHGVLPSGDGVPGGVFESWFFIAG